MEYLNTDHLKNNFNIISSENCYRSVLFYLGFKRIDRQTQISETKGGFRSHLVAKAGNNKRVSIRIVVIGLDQYADIISLQDKTNIS